MRASIEYELRPVENQIKAYNNICNRELNDTLFSSPDPINNNAVDPPVATYLTLMENLFLITANEFSRYSVENSANDGTWAFIEGGGLLILVYKKGLLILI